MAEKYYGIGPLTYCAGNPISLEDTGGSIFETAIDAASLILGTKSLVNNIKAGNVGAAIIDGLGVIADAVAVATPFIPGGVSVGIKAARSADRAIDGTRSLERVQHCSTGLKNAERIREGRQFEREALEAAKASGEDVVSNVRLVPENGIGNIKGNRSDVDQLIRNNNGTYTVVETKLTPKSKPSRGQEMVHNQVEKGTGRMEVRSTIEEFNLSPGSIIEVSDYRLIFKYP